MKENKINISGLLSTLLLVAFIVLKLCHVIDWGWGWVLAPLWMPMALGLVLIGLGYIIKGRG